ERRQPSLEAQIANIADEIAYNNHDVDDGLRAGLMTLGQLTDVPFFAEQLRLVERRHPGLEQDALAREVVRRMIGELVGDLIRASEAAIAEAAPAHVDDVRALRLPLIGYSEPFVSAQAALKQFLREHLYTHPHVRRMTDSARETIRLLFEAFSADYGRMPEKHAARAAAAEAASGKAGAARVIADYIAGMTDRFALTTRERLLE